MKKTLSAVPVTKSDLEKQVDMANTLLKSASWSVVPEVNEDDPSAYMKRLDRKEVSVSIRDLVQSVDPNDDLLSDVQLHTLRAIRGAFQVARHISSDYSDRVGVPKNASGMTPQQKTEVNEKKQSAAAIALFAMTRYIIWDIQSLINDNTFLESVNVDVDEVDLSRVVPALRCATFFLGRSIKSQTQGDDARLVAVVYKYAEALQQEILNRVGSLKHTDAFTSVTYQLEDSDFAISGFELTDFTSTTSVEFNRVYFDEIVGNQDAKHFARNDAKRRACYNVEAGKNVFTELGGITPIFMGEGIPGTGKSMMIAAYATLLSDYCAALEIPFIFHPLPDNIIDSFQGNSAKNMLAWMKPLQDPNHIVWAPIDDAENILENRIHQGVSEGVKAAIGVFLRYTEGAYAINRGNSAIGVFTNIPENIDPAVMSRIQARFNIDGAQSVVDIIDQNYLFWSKLNEEEPGFVNMQDPEGHEYLKAQAAVKSMGDISEDLTIPQNAEVRAIFEDALSVADPKGHLFFGEYYRRIQKVYKLFSSRDIRNIHSAINLRIMDWEVPDEWVEDPTAFKLLSYDDQMGLALEGRRENMNGLSFAEIMLQESNRYLDNMAKVADAEMQRNIEARLKKAREDDAFARAKIAEQTA